MPSLEFCLLHWNIISKGANQRDRTLQQTARQPVLKMESDKQEATDEEQETFKSLLTEWMENASANGIPNIQRSVHIIRKIVWILLVLVGTGRFHSPKLFQLTLRSIYNE